MYKKDQWMRIAVNASQKIAKNSSVELVLGQCWTVVVCLGSYPDDMWSGA